MKIKTPTQIWEEIIVPHLHKKYITQVNTVWKFETMIKQEGGEIHLDHFATRTPDIKLHELITRIGKAFDLEITGQYEFPDKKLKAVVLQSLGKEGFKWFSTLIEYKKLSNEAIKAVEEDLTRTNNVLSEKSLETLSRLEKDKCLTENEAQEFTHDIVWNFLSRQGPPVKKSTISLLAKESSEIVNALLLGPDFNHMGYDLNKLNIKDWYAQEVIEILYDRMLIEGFEMLPEIQGAPDALLRQTSTKAESKTFEVEEDNGTISHLISPYKFVELVQRGVQRDSNGKIIFDQHNKVKRFRDFIAKNTEKIYDSTKL
ncbi:MAG: hypothetical protein C5B43_03120 [Verrucomicrobia bacterium]|nr:MAG: hypothetical protein C5B43_03120 [Verrucomicrobiota bacterium]